MSKSKDACTELEAQIDDRLADQLDDADDELASELFGGTRLDPERSCRRDDSDERTGTSYRNHPLRAGDRESELRLDLERERERELGPTYERAVAGRPLTFRASELLPRGGRDE
jgi:hypothetical protein